MIIHEVLGNLRELQVGEKNLEIVGLEWHEVDKRILRKTTDKGTEVGIALTNHGRLNAGDVLFNDGKQVIVVELLPTMAVVIEPRNMREMALVVYQLGNRHAQVFLEGEQVLVPMDVTIVELFKKLGISVRVERRRLEHGLTPAGGHSH